MERLHTIAGGIASGKARQTSKIVADKAEAVRLHVHDDLSVNQIGFKLGVNPGQIQKWLKKAGVYKCGHRPRNGNIRLDGSAVHSPNIEKLLAMAFEDETRRISKMDDCEHWRWHGAAVSYRAMIPYYRNHALNRAKHAAQMKARYHAGKTNRLKSLLAARIYKAMKRGQHGRKAYRTMHLIGCTIAELRVHLQSTFLPGMTWQNYGQWHIDHKRPCNSFDLSQPDHQLQCFHYTNLQALWGRDNISKGDRWQGRPQGGRGKRRVLAAHASI